MLFTNKYRDKANTVKNEQDNDSNYIRTLLNHAKNNMNHIHRQMETVTNPYHVDSIEILHIHLVIRYIQCMLNVIVLD